MCEWIKWIRCWWWVRWWEILPFIITCRKKFHDTIVRLKDVRDGQHLAVMRNRSESLVKLADEHKLVIDYIANKPKVGTDSIPQTSNVTEWCNTLQTVLP